jgi:formate hydrogenlyase transcriptional activator
MSANSGPGDERLEILVVEDSPTQAELLRYLLEQSGYRAAVASTGAQALALLSERTLSAIISNVILPEMNGYELCRRIRADERTRDIPVILLTSLTSSADVLEGLACGADSLITKPYSKHYLITNIQQILANRQPGKGEIPRSNVEVSIAGKTHSVAADRQRILTLLLSRYEEAAQHNDELREAQEELRTVNERLEEKVRERTAALSESEERYRRIVETANDGIWAMDADCRTTYANPRLAMMLGRTVEELLGHQTEDFMFPEDVPAHLEKTARRHEGESGTYELRLRRKDGSECWALVSDSPVLDAQGSYAGSFAMLADVTERKQAEDELRDAFAEIQRLKEQLEAENVYLRSEIKLGHVHGDIVGESPAIKQTLALVEQVAPTDSTVLIQGETGTGKELVARSIHSLSPRKDRPLVTVSCAAIPSALVESELFGREKGAYTGALTRQAGRFEVADKSTLFLDEVGELPAETQAKLLRVLQEGKFERLGSSNTITVDVRVIAATNRDLEQAVKDGRFREDLFYRLHVFPITVPPLRERREDIPLLIWTFVREFSEKMGKRIECIPKKTIGALSDYPWPGNVRGLRNTIERAMILSTGTTLHVELPGARPGDVGPTRLDDAQRSHVTRVLESTNWRIRGKGGAAELLGLKPTTLEYRIKIMGIRRQPENKS